MTTITELAKLLQLASPALPVGAYSYSQGLEAAIEAGIVRDAASAKEWIGDVLALTVGQMEAAVVFHSMAVDAAKINGMFLASRETAELRAETVQMGYSLNRLLPELGLQRLECDEPSFPAVFGHAARQWTIAPKAAVAAYLWSWLENQVMAAVKTVPLGQTEGQKMLAALACAIEPLCERAAALEADDLPNFAPRLAILSAMHETQYSRLFRS
ncbi:MAG: urease accessory protein UreF [Betaproteobacteria bacterium]|nr:urease accessory protein UreF [Betaproteobacteria bacterium]